VLYDVDFAALPSQTIGAAGSYTIDGKTWWAKGAKSANHTESAVVNGVGLRFSVTGALGYQPTGDTPGGGFNTQLMFMPLAQLTGFSASSPTALMFTFAATSAWPGTLSSIQLGLIGAASNGAAFLSADRGSQTWFGCSSGALAASFAGAQGYQAGVSLTPVLPVLADHCYGFVRGTRRGVATFHQQWTGAFPNPMDAFPSGESVLLATQDPVNLGVAVLLNAQNPWQLQLTRLRVLQPKVP
jgi:hypothetical protein